MATITLDTREFMKKLQAVRFTEEQSEVLATAHRRVMEDTLVARDHDE